MQLVLFVAGLGLILTGVYFAVGGFGSAAAGGGVRSVRIEGPAWLLLVGLGLLTMFAAAYAEPVLEDEDGAATTTTTTTTAPTGTTTTAPTGTTPTPPSSPDQCTRVVDDDEPPLNVRSGPGTAATVVGTLENGTEIVVVENRDDWLRIDDPAAGWVFTANTTCA